jgi:hypothetical protein
MKLTEVERLTLANQYRILEKLEPDAEGHRHAAEALESGYEGLYERLMFQWISKPVPEAITEPVCRSRPEAMLNLMGSTETMIFLTRSDNSSFISWACGRNCRIVR